MVNKRAKILIIDDDPDFVEATKVVIAAKGYDVLTAYSGQEGLEKARRERPDLIVLDIIMPQEDGFKVCKQIKADVNLAATPVIILTNIARLWGETNISRYEGFGLTAEDYFDKPVQPAKLLERIERLLEKTVV